MSKLKIARQLSQKRVITSDGEDFGRLVDLIINEITGKIEDLVIEPNPDNPHAEKLRKDDGMVLVAYESVLAVSDYVIVDKRNMQY